MFCDAMHVLYRHVLGFVWDVYVPSIDDLHAIR